MPLVTTNAGELELLDKMLRDPLVTNEDYIFRLYRTAYTPVDTTTVANFTEANFTNYAAKTLTRSGWNAAVTVSNKAESSYGATPQSWTCGATSNTIHGYWIQGATSGVVLWAEEFATSRVLADGDVLNITPKITLDKE